MHDLGSTLVGIATPPGRGGIGCVRLSGDGSREISDRLFRSLSRSPIRFDDPPRFGRFLGRDGAPVDHGYLVLFSAGRSYTGQRTAELWSHGSPAVLAEIVAAAVAAGAVPAGPGEFTYRALRLGRVDLARAEAVRDLVAARTLYQARVAFAQAEGALSRRLEGLREGLSDLIARGEAAVEFVEESETHLARGALERGIDRLREEAAGLLAGFRKGRIVREGASVAIVGLPNVGKSSLFNRLLAHDRAIVSPEPGTTRDTLEETLDLGGIPVKLVDTAGLREIENEVESEGVRRARAAREESDLAILVLDAGRALELAERQAVAEARASRTLVVVNKADLAAGPPGGLRVSALTGEGIDALREALVTVLLGAGPVEPPILTDVRHALAIEEALAHIERARAAASSGLPEDLVLEDLRAALREVGVITGEAGTEDLYDRIFRTFCIGK
jgi:tRNA modification GTPase